MAFSISPAPEGKVQERLRDRHRVFGSDLDAFDATSSSSGNRRSRPRVIPARILTIGSCGCRRSWKNLHGAAGPDPLHRDDGSGIDLLAAMIDQINTQRNEHIMTVEDPIEFLHRDKKSIVNQREVEVDTKGFGVALRSALRPDPDVILVGEMRDYETIETALTAAETGHLVFSTLHTLDATETVNRIIRRAAASAEAYG